MTESKKITSVEASHILVETEEQAVNILARLDEGASFSELAMATSKCPSGQRGGSLGVFTQGQMVKPFEEAAFKLEVGKTSKPVETQFGWHIIHRTA